jgi:ribosomal protein S17
MSVDAQTEFKIGDRVRVIEREPGTPDPKSLTYYPFYQNLVGSVIKCYDDNTVTVEIDRKKLPNDILERHELCEVGMKEKWLDSMSEDDREKMSEKHKRFKLRYTLLLPTKDLIHDDSPAPRS